MHARRPFSPALVAAALLLACQPVGLRADPYLGADVPNVVRLLPAPPAVGSPEQQADLDEAARIYAARTPAQVALGTSQLELTIFSFAPVLGDSFQPGRYPRIEALFAQVATETSAALAPGKKLWNRPRPFVADPARFPDTPFRETSASYPSGHATRGVVYARLLTELFPAKRIALLELGDTVGWVRVQVGVHYPSDIDAGRTLGRALAAAFLRSPAFQKDLAAAKAELASGGRSWLVRRPATP